MKFRMIHENYNVADLGRSLEFYRQALGLEEVRRKEAEDGSFTDAALSAPGGLSVTAEVRVIYELK